MDEEFSSASQLEALESEPNKVAEYYRAFHKAKDQADYNVISDYKKHLPHFDCVRIAEDGTTLVCSSNLNGRLWKGSVVVYKTPDNAVEGDVAKAVAGTVTSAGIADGVFLAPGEFFVVGEDSGAVTLLRLMRPMGGPSPPTILHLGSSYTHNDSVTSIATLPDKKKIVTSSYDLTIKVINTDGLLVENEFSPAHGHPVLSVATQTNSEVFASCADHNEVLLWDIRQEKPAHLVFKTEINTTCLNWQPESHILAIGDQIGSVILADTRNPKTQLAKFSIPNHRPLHRLLFNPQLTSSLAVVGDFTEVYILDCSSGDLKQTSTFTSHADFARGLAWKGDSLYSCGWDSRVIENKKL
ncbi:methylosome protein WDR77-like [Neocloeon triangulifer]|uniref:methylosome protein WDR77-like n=1 Tax=Neocloeon triangulifer TaxID=2078957 RepID=UPI00286F041B|nr:methylosome protein WDR77-like [Neocloeon triangulifer]